MWYLAVGLVALLVGGLSVAYLTRSRELVVDTGSLHDSWERQREADLKEQATSDPADYFDSGLDELR